MMDLIENWMTGYRKAWESNDADDIRALFTANAEYRTSPSALPWKGHEEIVAGWKNAQDEPGSTEFQWEVLSGTGDTVIVTATTVYRDGPTFDNLWVIRLAPNGRATSFTEWFMERPGPASA